MSSLFSYTIFSTCSIAYLPPQLSFPPEFYLPHPSHTATNSHCWFVHKYFLNLLLMLVPTCLSSGFALAIISHVLCSRFPMFAAKLLTHMMLSCLGTQVTQFCSDFLLRHFTAKVTISTHTYKFTGWDLRTLTLLALVSSAFSSVASCDYTHDLICRWTGNLCKLLYRHLSLCCTDQQHTCINTAVLNVVHTHLYLHQIQTY